jgi:hydrogenase nickel incorporation protein HypB
VTEGDDKPLKYPAMFARSTVLVLNKIDLSGYCPDFSLARARENASSINPGLRVFEVSCRSGRGIDRWLEWLESERRERTRTS